MATASEVGAHIDRVEVSAYQIPATDKESDGTEPSVLCALCPGNLRPRLLGMESVMHIEYFFDHYRIEHLLFDGTVDPTGGLLTPDRSRPGLGLELKRADASRYEV